MNNNINKYQKDERFLSCKKAFLVTGITSEYENNQNIEMLEENKTGYWLLEKDRTIEGDLIFLILPNIQNSKGYPRKLYAGIINKIDRYPEYQNRVVFGVERFFHLETIENSIKKFLLGKTPPQGSKVLSIWDIYDLENENNESLFPEGTRILKKHYELERDNSISKKAKEKRLSEEGKLECDICNFNFSKVYGDIGKDFIEAHHLTPVSKLDGKKRTKITDLALLCSNCHRMVHRKNPLPKKEELYLLLKDQKHIF